MVNGFAEDGPDRLLPASGLTATLPDGCVDLRDMSSASSVPPISVPTLLKDAAENCPESVALGVKRNGEWIKWNYAQYYKDSRTIAKAFIKLGQLNIN